MAKKADPTCTVVGVCTAGTDLGYIETVLKHDGAKTMDAMSIHPYRYLGVARGEPVRGGDHAGARPAGEYGAGDKKLWLTEIWLADAQGARGVTEEVSGNCLVRMQVQAMSLPFVER